MELIFIRHAHADERTFGSRDQYRPLSERGHEQARLIAEALADFDVIEVRSSPASRCVQTVAPLAEARGLTVIEDEALWETASGNEVDACLSDALRADRPTHKISSDTEARKVAIVLCSHGNIIPAVVEAAASRGAAVSGRGCERGSIWILTYEGSEAVTAHYLSPRKGYLPDGAARG